MEPLAEDAATDGGDGSARGTNAAAPDASDAYISIEYDAEFSKPYLGGYRDTRSGLEYHHGVTQTPVERVSKWAHAPARFARETQTTVVVTRSAQTYRECGAQTVRRDLYSDTSSDRSVAPRPYFTAAALQSVREVKALVIQCHWRGFIARRRAAGIRDRLRAKQSEEAEAEMQRTAAAAAKHEADVDRRLHPRTHADFAVLYDEVEAWRVSETARIKGELSDERERGAALALLLAKETALLSTIERLRSAARKENGEKAAAQRIAAMAAPKKWALGADMMAHVHTPHTTRAAELKSLYDGLVAPDLEAHERLDLLSHIKLTVLEFDSELTREIVALIEREEDLIQRSRPSASMTGLRTRLKNLFTAFCHAPEYNPEAGRFAGAAPHV